MHDSIDPFPPAYPGDEVCVCVSNIKWSVVFGLPQCFTVQSILEGFRWKIDKTFDEFEDLHRTVS